ncbi:unnamed protein product [Sphagnum troendelagicum]|uniref:MADF domain-containing protein n=1 Tax=Sphagnum troendelagicum TaxID=128251 RepID=A0ABP0UB90_9BRYO
MECMQEVIDPTDPQLVSLRDEYCKKKRKLYIKKKDTSLKCANFFAAVTWFSTCFGEMEPSCQQRQNATLGVGDNF